MPALQYSLEWIYQFLHFGQSDQFLYRQCASALVSLIAVNTSAGQIFAKLPICFSKWFAEASKATVDEVKPAQNTFHSLDKYSLVSLIEVIANRAACHMSERHERVHWHLFGVFRHIFQDIPGLGTVPKIVWIIVVSTGDKLDEIIPNYSWNNYQFAVKHRHCCRKIGCVPWNTIRCPIWTLL